MSSRDPDLRPGSRLGLSASPPRRRRSIGMAITAAAAIVCAGGLWVAYQHFQSVPPDSADIPIIRADRSATKIKPPDNSNAAAPDEDEGVYSMGKPSGNAEHLLPPPEEPMAKPAPASPPSAQEIETAAAALPPSIATPPPAAPQPAPPVIKPSPTAPAKAPTLAPQPASQPALGPPAPAKPASPPPAMTSSPALGDAGSYRVQIAATKDDAAAQSEWARLQKAHPELLGALAPTVVRADLGDRGTFYRLQAGPLPDRAQADKLCGQLRAASVGCMVVHGGR